MKSNSLLPNGLLRRVSVAVCATSLLGLMAGCAAGQVHTAKKPAAAQKAKAPEKKVADEAATITVADADGGLGPDASAAPLPVSRFSPRLKPGKSRNHDRWTKPFSVNDLPVIVIPPAFEDKDAPTTIDGSEASEISITKNNYGYGSGYGYGVSYNSVTVKGAGFARGSLRVSNQDAWFFDRDGTQYGGLSLQCGPYDPVVSARWEGLVKGADGQIEKYEIVDGWFDRKKCKAKAVRRTSVKATEIVAGALYGFRECGDSQCNTKAQVAFVIPDATQVVSQEGPLRSPSGALLSRIEVPIRQGSSQSLLAQLQQASPNRNSYIQRTLSVELSQGTQDPEMLALAYIDVER